MWPACRSWEVALVFVLATGPISSAFETRTGATFANQSTGPRFDALFGSATSVEEKAVGRAPVSTRDAVADSQKWNTGTHKDRKGRGTHLKNRDSTPKMKKTLPDKCAIFPVGRLRNECNKRRKNMMMGMGMAMMKMSADGRKSMKKRKNKVNGDESLVKSSIPSWDTTHRPTANSPSVRPPKESLIDSSPTIPPKQPQIDLQFPIPSFSPVASPSSIGPGKPQIDPPFVKPSNLPPSSVRPGQPHIAPELPVASPSSIRPGQPQSSVDAPHGKPLSEPQSPVSSPSPIQPVKPQLGPPFGDPPGVSPTYVRPGQPHIDPELPVSSPSSVRPGQPHIQSPSLMPLKTVPSASPLLAPPRQPQADPPSPIPPKPSLQPSPLPAEPPSGIPGGPFTPPNIMEEPTTSSVAWSPIPLPFGVVPEPTTPPVDGQSPESPVGPSTRPPTPRPGAVVPPISVIASSSPTLLPSTSFGVPVVPPQNPAIQPISPTLPITIYPTKPLGSLTSVPTKTAENLPPGSPVEQGAPIPPTTPTNPSPTIDVQTASPSVFSVINPTLRPEISTTPAPTTLVIQAPSSTPSVQKVSPTGSFPPSVVPSSSNSPLNFLASASPSVSAPVTVRGSPFSIIFDLPESAELVIDLPETSKLVIDSQAQVLQFYESFFFEFFEDRDDTILLNFDGEILESDLTIASTTFVLDLTFDPASEFIPTSEEVDVFAEIATFEEPFLSDFLEALNSLGVDNLFSATQSLQFVPRPDLLAGDSAKRVVTLPLTPFLVTYLTTGEPTQKETNTTSQVTISILDDFFRNWFDDVRPNSFSGLVRNRVTNEEGTPNQILYSLSVEATHEVLDTVTKQEMNQLLRMAFEPPAMNALLGVLNALPEPNPYASTRGFTLSFVAEDTEKRSQRRSVISAIAVAAFSLLALSSFAYVGSRFWPSKPPKDRLREDARVADQELLFGETSNCSAESGYKIYPRRAADEWSEPFEDEHTITFVDGSDPLLLHSRNSAD